MKIDDWQEVRGTPEVCSVCVNFDNITGMCPAFPDGIPDEIWKGLNDHTQPVEGDHGIQFVPYTQNPDVGNG